MYTIFISISISLRSSLLLLFVILICCIMHTQSSLSHKVRSSFLCFSGGHGSHAPSQSPPDSPTTPSSCRSWRKKSPAAYHRGRSRQLLSRMGWKPQRITQSGEFSYDPCSYALNFEDDSRLEAEDFPLRPQGVRLHPPPASRRKYS